MSNLDPQYLTRATHTFHPRSVRRLINLKPWRRLLAVVLAISCGGSLAQSDEDAVTQVMDKFRQALESLDVSGSDILFTVDSQIVEFGKIEGNYADYVANHLGPELAHFSSLSTRDYHIDVTVDEPYAFTTESYVYEIVLKSGGRTIKRNAVVTSILRKEATSWKIMNMHSSSRAAH